MEHRSKVVVVGAGFGGLAVARELGDDPAVEVTLVDGNNYHTFWPLLYQVATAGLDTSDVCFPVRRIFRRQPGVTVVLGWVTGLDLDRREVTVDGDRTFGYDHLVLAAGTVNSSFGVPGVEEHTFPLKSADDALDLRTHLLAGFERAAAGRDPRKELAVVIVGGGPTGVELAGSIRELVDKVLCREFPELDLAQLPITLVELGDRVLAPFHPDLSAAAARALRGRGVALELGVGVERVEPGTVVLADGRRLAASTIVWAAGVTANPLARLAGVEQGRGGRIVTEADLSLPGRPEVFAIGDIALPPGPPLPQVAQPAIQGGRHAAAQIRARLAGEPTRPFRYRDRGSMATIGRNSAVAEFPNGWRFHGVVGWGMWLVLHLVELIGFRNRLSVLVNWVWNYLTYDRGARIILRHRMPPALPPAPQPAPPGSRPASDRGGP